MPQAGPWTKRQPSISASCTLPHPSPTSVARVLAMNCPPGTKKNSGGAGGGGLATLHPIRFDQTLLESGNLFVPWPTEAH